jgi:hypothetical protein
MNLHSTGWSSIGADNLVRDDRDRIEGRATYTSAAESELLNGWVLNCTTGIANAIATLLVVSMRRSGIVVGCCRCHCYRYESNAVL